MNKNTLAMAVVVALNTSALAADADDELDESFHNVITVTASRIERNTDEVTNTVSVIGEEQIDKESARNIKDLIRYEPGVSVEGSGRFGFSGFKIRGIGGGRILTLIDGAPLANEFSFGPNLSARRNFVDLDALKTVEIVRGSSSSLYGSNALGGTVSFITKDPEDYFGLNDDNYYTSYKGGYSSEDSSQHHTVTYATGNETLQAMFIGTYRNLSELETYFDDNTSGAVRTSANPQEAENTNFFAKFLYRLAKNHELRLILESFDGEVDTNVLSSAGSVVFGTVKQSVLANDERTRARYSLQYQYDSTTALSDNIMLDLYRQRSETDQFTFEDRLPPSGIQQTRNRQSFYEQTNTGLKLQVNKAFDSDIDHWISYGLDWDQSDTETLRLGSTFNTADGTPVPEFSNFPTRDFPNSEYTSYGLFVQDEIRFNDGAFRLVPSLRYDRFELEPTVDSIYLSGNTGSPTPAAYHESEVSAKLGAIYQFNKSWSLFAQYSEGFKAPPIDAVNTGFTNFAGGYTTLPNPDLKPESSESYEIGLRNYNDNRFFEVTFYQNDYESFIESLTVKGFNPATGLLEFQARNLPSATIDGIEIKGGLELKSLSESFDNFSLRYAYAFSDGEGGSEEDSPEQPIDSIDPQQFIAGLAFDDSDEAWGTELIWILTDRKNSKDIDSSGLQPGEVPFETPGRGTLDLLGYYHVNDHLRINWAVFNATDKLYWLSGNTIGQLETDNNRRLSESGRSFSVTVKYEF